MGIQVSPHPGNPNLNVVQLSGRLDITSAEATSAAMTSALEQSGAGLIVDMAAMDFISSAGLRVLIMLRNKAQAGGKQIGFIHAHPAVYKIFKIAQLDTLLRFFEDDDEAIQALWPPTEKKGN
jgi:anti-anti-sigma factor